MVDNKGCVYLCRNGGVLSWCREKNTLCDFKKECSSFVRVAGFNSFKKVSSDKVLSRLDDDGKPLENIFLKEKALREEKLEVKKRVVFENFREERFKNFKSDLLQHSDDVFDSKGDDISEDEYLKNEMEAYKYERE